MAQLTKSRFLLEPLAADPSLRGIMGAITLTLKGVQARPITLDSLAPKFDAFSTAIENSINNRPAWFSWREALSGQPFPRGERRVSSSKIEPILNYTSLEPGEDATNTIRETPADLGFAQDGVTVRIDRVRFPLPMRNSGR